jgi:hypothetical protein
MHVQHSAIHHASCCNHKPIISPRFKAKVGQGGVWNTLTVHHRANMGEIIQIKSMVIAGNSNAHTVHAQRALLPLVGLMPPLRANITMDIFRNLSILRGKGA